jgi:hypothetical protein
MLGVTPQTIYRWELPPTASEARRPRGADRARLDAWLSTGVPPVRTDAPEPRVASFHDVAPAPTLTDADAGMSRVLPALERLLDSDHRQSYDDLVRLLATGRDLSANARAVACVAVAFAEVVHRSDVRSALLAISPALSDAESSRLSVEVAAKVYAVAALVHAWCDGMLFDLGRVHAFGARVEALSETDHHAACIACLASLIAAVQVGDSELLERGFARLEETRWLGLPPLLSLIAEEFRGLKPMFAGNAAVSTDTYEHVVAEAERLGHPLVLARALGRLALCQLDNLVDPEVVLALARRAKSISHMPRFGPGVQHVFAIRAEIEALVRLGRVNEALTVLTELEEWVVETGMPALSAITVQTRLLVLCGRTDALVSLAAQLRQCDLPSLRHICGAYASYVEAQAALATSEDPALTISLFERAEADASRWPYLLREVLLHRATAHAVAGDHVGGRGALRRAQRYVDGFPSAWCSAQLRRLEGGLLTAKGQWSEGRQLLESAEATFLLAHDACDAALTRYICAMLANIYETPRPAAVDEARRALEGLGITPPPGMLVGVERFRESRRANQERGHGRVPHGLERLIVPLQRISIRGAAPTLVLRELVSIVAGLFPMRGIRLEEIDSQGVARPVFGGSAAPTNDHEWLEFSDGAGRLLRIGITGALDDESRAMLSILTTTSSLALEAATLRSFGERSDPKASDDRSPELPGFVAASPSMRKLRAELFRLAGSQATVIITGESGVGKDVVARAIHDLSERSGKSYVAFNCATVPRDLFEGQLFGYKRGAFTGAASDQPGVIRAASGGTLFLDEIGELPLEVQPKLLRFLENGEVFPLGERRPVRVDVRILAATHRDLGLLVREGKFREDLYYRLQVVPIVVPPLRDRREDVPVLARHFVRDLSRRGEPPVLAPDAVSALVSYHWPGNVRELRNVIERALAFSPRLEVLRAEHLRILDERGAPV